MRDPIDPRFLTDNPFGTTSFWLQPWRAYFDTWPASQLLESVGINFNVRGAEAEATAQLLHDSGFKLARIGTDWGAMSYADPTQLKTLNAANITARLTALHNHGLRPLIVLDAYSGAPAPERNVTLETTAAAPAGALTVQLTPASAALVVPGKTGFNYLAFKGAPDILVTSVGSGDVATLSRPLLSTLPAGPHGASTLLYSPFSAPKLASGQPNPEFQATLGGWLAYVGAVSRLAASVVGPGGYDLEIWNELVWGSQFLNIENYYRSAAGTASAASGTAGGLGGGEASASTSEEDPETDYSSEAPAQAESANGSGQEAGQAGEEGAEGEGFPAEAGATAAVSASRSILGITSSEIRKALLDATVAYVRDPANGLSPGVGITNGFASQSPFPSGAAAPLGLTALSKHPYAGPIEFPSEYREDGAHPRNALGELDTTSRASFTPLFIPTFQSLFPEYTLSALSAETLTRDIAPFTTYVYNFPHGRYVAPAGQVPVQKWITEYNLGPGKKGVVVGPDGTTPQTGASATLSAADKAHFHSKALLRNLVAMVGKGISRDYFFAAGQGAFSLIGDEFFAALEAHPGTYPGDQLGGETMHAFSRMLSRFQGPGPGGEARQLKLLSIEQDGNHSQFSGDGTIQHPTLYDRDVLAVLPFQSSPARFVIPVYVMTRDLLTLYEPGAPASDITRFDLPDETFRITLGNLPQTANPPTVASYDPLHDQSAPARLVSREGETAVFEVSATDYPRLLTLDYSGG